MSTIKKLFTNENRIQEMEWLAADRENGHTSYTSLTEEGDVINPADAAADDVNSHDYDPDTLQTEGMLEGRYVMESVGSYSASSSSSPEDQMIQEEEEKEIQCRIDRYLESGKASE